MSKPNHHLILPEAQTLARLRCMGLTYWQISYIYEVTEAAIQEKIEERAEYNLPLRTPAPFLATRQYCPGPDPTWSRNPRGGPERARFRLKKRRLSPD